MSALAWLIGLVALTVGLFLVAYFQPYWQKLLPNKKSPNINLAGETGELEKFARKLSQLLPEYELTTKTDGQPRIIITRHNRQCATVVLGQTTPARTLGDVRIFGVGHFDELPEIADGVRAHYAYLLRA